MTPLLSEQRLRGYLSFNRVVIGSCVLLLALFSYTVSTGLNTTSDSLYYLTAARSMRATGQLLAPDGSPYRYWGPLYPLLLAMLTGEMAIRWLHALALVGNLLLWSVMGRKLLPVGRALVLPLGLALSTAMLVPSRFVWSETVFALLLAAYAYTLLQWGRTADSRWLVLATAVGFLLPLQRTTGFFLLAGAGLGLLFNGWCRGNWGRILCHWAGCAVGGLVWNGYAEAVTGPPVYQHVGGWPKLLGSLADYGFVLLRWCGPMQADWRETLAVVCGMALLLIMLLLWPWQPARQQLAAKRGLVWLWFVVAAYIGGLLLAVNITRGAAGIHDTERYLGAIAGPVLLLALANWPVATSRWGRRLQVLLLIGWLSYSAVRVMHSVRFLRQRASSFPVETRFGPVAHFIPDNLSDEQSGWC